MAQTITRTLHYKRATYLNGEHNLQNMLATALGRHQAVASRMEELHPTEHTKRFINSYRSQFGMLFGNLLIYSPNRNQALLTVSPDAHELDVRQIAPPQINGQKTEFLESILYFGIFGNHVVVLQSTSLRSRALEAYLNWLLCQGESSLGKENGVYLSDEPSIRLREQVQANGVKAARLAFPFELEPLNFGGDKEEFIQESTRFRPTGSASNILSNIFGNDWLQDLRLNDALDDSIDDSRIKVVVEVTYDRHTTTSGQDLLDRIAMSFRHLDEEEAVIKLNRGGRLKGDDLKIFGPVSVSSYNGLVDQGDLFPKMHAWLQEKFEQGVLAA